MTPTVVFGALSGALVISGLLGPRVGHVIDTFGGRGLLAVSNLVFATGLLLLSFAHGLLLLGRCVAAARHRHGHGPLRSGLRHVGAHLWQQRARSSITGITLIAGFASTVGWPLTTWLAAHYGWRVACQVWAAMHLLLALPLNLSLPR